MALKLRESDLAANRLAVIEDVQIRFLEINNLLPFGILNPGVTNVPLLRNRPVKNRGAGRHFRDGQGNEFSQGAQRLAQTVTSDAAANGIKFGDRVIEL